jgi:bacterial/archaeal transporter family protein
MNDWILYAVGAAVLYGLHQVFTKLASPHIGDGIGGFIVEATAALTIAIYLMGLKASGKWDQGISTQGVVYSALTGLCVGVGTLFFFLLFQKGGPLSAVPAILAGGAALMALIGIFVFKEPAHGPRLLGVLLSIAGLFLLRY